MFAMTRLPRPVPFRLSRGRTTLLGLVLLVGFILPTRLFAQDHRFGAGYNVGAIWFTPLNPQPGQTLAGGSASDIQIETGWVIGLQFEQWFGGGRVGARVGGALTQLPLTAPDTTGRDAGLWLIDASVLLRFLPARPTTTVNAYIGAGVGIVQYQFGTRGIVVFDSANALYNGDTTPRVGATASFGFDIMTGLRWHDSPIGIRLEATDLYTRDSPMRRLSAPEQYGSVHNVRVTLGVFTGFEVLR